MSLLLNTPVAGTEAPRNQDFLMSEDVFGSRSRDQITLVAQNDGLTSWVSGTVLGQQNIATAAAFATTSSGFTCGTITLAAGVLEGVYEAFFTTAGATGEFELMGPNGVLVGSGKVGTAFSAGGIGFTLTDAGAHAVLGDVFTITVGTATFTIGGSDTGNFTCGAVSVLPGVTPGTFTFTMTDATHFTGVAPDGTVLPAGVFGTLYQSGGLKFTITAGGTPAVAGDTFTIATNIGSGNYVPVNASAADGTQNAAAVLCFQQYVGGATNVKAAAITRGAEVKSDLLAWPTGTTDDQVRNWTAQLKALAIIARKDLV